MSYILEALRRSQAERERGQVPGLHAQAATNAAPAAPRAGVAVPGLVLAAALAVVALLGLGVWLWRSAAPALPQAAPVSAVVPALVAVPLPAVVSAPPVLVAPQVPAPAVLPLVVSAPMAAPMAAPTAAPAPAVLTPNVQASVAAPSAPAVAVAAASRAQPRVLRLAELAPEQRRDLPPLVMGGSIWSESALGRFVIVNGQVVREGEAAAPGVMVERIGPKAVLLRWRDLHLEVPL